MSRSKHSSKVSQANTAVCADTVVCGCAHGAPKSNGGRETVLLAQSQRGPTAPGSKTAVSQPSRAVEKGWPGRKRSFLRHTKTFSEHRGLGHSTEDKKKSLCNRAPHHNPEPTLRHRGAKAKHMLWRGEEMVRGCGTTILRYRVPATRCPWRARGTYASCCHHRNGDAR